MGNVKKIFVREESISDDNYSQLINHDDDYKGREQGGSNLNAFMSCVCVVAGAGTLGIPYAIQQGGWITIIFLILAAVMATYANIKLIECLYYDGNRRRTSMSELAYDAFGRSGSAIVGFLFNCISVGCPILYLILIGDNLQMIFSKIDFGMKNWIYLVASIMCIPYILLKTMKDVKLLSLFGVLTVVLMVFVVMIMSIIDYPNNKDNPHDIIVMRKLPISLATVSFSYGGNIVYPYVEESMRKPRNWPKVVSFVMFTITILYLIIGFFGYFTYGNNAKSPIYLNLPDGILVKAVIILITLHVTFALPIYQTVFSLELENYYSINENKLGKLREFIYRTLLRLVTVIAEVYIAVSIPFFADIMSLLGALANGSLVVVIPLLLWLKLVGWSKLENNNWEKVWIIFTLIFSITIATIGSYDAKKK
ncbi:4134_t:CDS:2 [Entrophospora sp. SA101]|nr:4134_t:CDS:2 [Entrophospora sp. SA101]